MYLCFGEMIVYIDSLSGCSVTVYTSVCFQADAGERLLENTNQTTKDSAVPYRTVRTPGGYKEM